MICVLPAGTDVSIKGNVITVAMWLKFLSVSFREF